MPYRIKVKMTPTSTYQVDLDDAGKVTAEAGLLEIIQAQLPGFPTLINELVTRLAASGWVSIEAEKL